MDDVKVEQVDRDAAAPFVADGVQSYSGRQAYRREVVRGEHDKHPIVQAFARHRIKAQPVPASSDLVERVAEAIYRQAKMNIGADANEFPWYEATVQSKERNRATARAIIPVVQADEREDWQPVETAPAACCVLAARFDHDIGDWVMAYVMSPPSKPFTHWLFIKGPPASAALKAGE